MKKYAVIFRWYKDYYCTELLMKRSYYIKANNSEEAGHKAFIRLDSEFKLDIDNNLNIVDEISIRDLTTKRKHRKDRYNLIYSL